MIDRENVGRSLISLINSGVTVTLEPDPFTGKPVGVYSNKELPPTTVKPKLGEPGFNWPACSICGSTSLRCGCD